MKQRLNYPPPKNPQLFVIEYYDELIRKIDLSTEIKLKSLKQDDQTARQRLEWDRSKMIEKLNESRAEHMQFCTTIRQELSTPDDLRSDKKRVEYLKSKIFRNKYCLLLDSFNTNTLNLKLFVFDFYLSGKVPEIKK